MHMDKRSMTELLTAIRWSKADLARQAKVSPVTVWRWAKSEPEIVMLYLKLTARSMGV